HQLGLNWVFVWMHKRPWTRIIEWEYTPDYGMLIPDAEATLFNVITEKNQTIFVEFDRDTTIFNKIQLYNDFYESGCYQDAEWAQGPDARFPEVLIVTINHARMQHIIKMINSKNRNGIRFRVKMLDEIRTDSTCKPYL